MGTSARGRGIGQMRTGGGGGKTSHFCGRPLWTTPWLEIIMVTCSWNNDTYYAVGNERVMQKLSAFSHCNWMFFTGCLCITGLCSASLSWSGGAYWALLWPTSKIFAIPPRVPATRGRSSLRSLERGVVFVSSCPVYYLSCSDLGQVVNLSLPVA